MDAKLEEKFKAMASNQSASGSKRRAEDSPVEEKSRQKNQKFFDAEDDVMVEEH